MTGRDQRGGGTPAVRGRSRVPDRSADGGAAAVEFALVVPILVALLFGIVDYGLWFSDSLSVRHGVREAARQAVVEDFDPSGTCTMANDLRRVACFTERRIGAVGGDTYVKVRVRDGQPWDVGNQLQVCAIVVVEGLTGITPMPTDGAVRSDVTMRIEQKTEESRPTQWANGLPAGVSWDGPCA